MTLGYGGNKDFLAETFRATRESIGLPQSLYARLFEVERTFVQELEAGLLPAALDQRLLRFLLLTITLQPRKEFLRVLMKEMNSFYGLEHILTQASPLIVLYEQLLGKSLVSWPWVVESVNFRCKAMKRKRSGSFLMLWAERSDIHNSLLKTLPRQISAYINFLNGRTLIIMPEIFLFLDLNIARSRNPLVKEMEALLDRREQISLAVPRLVTPKPILETMALDQMRMFGYSQEAGLLRELENQI